MLRRLWYYVNSARSKTDETTSNKYLNIVVNYRQDKLFTLKSVHNMSFNMNTIVNKTLRKEYVVKLNNYIQQSKQVVWLDVTNFNFFCWWTQGRTRIGHRALLNFCLHLFKCTINPSPNVYLIGPISVTEVVHFQH